MQKRHSINILSQKAKTEIKCRNILTILLFVCLFLFFFAQNLQVIEIRSTSVVIC